MQKRINSSKNKLNREDDKSKSNNQIKTSKILSVSRLAKTPDRNIRRFSSQNIDLLADSEVITIKKNEISFNNYSKQEIQNNSSFKNIIKINSLNNNSNKSNKQNDFDLIGSEHHKVKSLKSIDVSRKKSISVSNYNMDLSYKEISKYDENSFQLNDNNMLRVNNSLFEEIKNNSIKNNNNNLSGRKSLKNGKNGVF